MGRGPNNTMVPMVREARDFLSGENSGLVTARKIQDRLERSAEAMKVSFRSMDPEAARRAQQASAIKTSLIEWPSFRGKDGEFIHLDPDVEHPASVWLRVVTYRKERIADAEASEVKAEQRYIEALHREQLAAGVPAVAEPTPEPVTMETESVK